MRPIEDSTKPPSRRGPISRLARGLERLAVAGLALALVGQLGRFSAPADALNQFAPLWLSLGILGGLARLLLPGPRRAAALVAAASALLAAYVLGPAFSQSFGRARPCGDPGTTIVDFNVWKENRDPARAVAWIRAQKPDLVVLEEAALNGGEVRAAMAVDLPFQIDCLASDHRCSTVILSRTPPLASGGLAKGDAENRKALSGAWAAFATDRGPMTVVGLHLDRPWPFGVEQPSRLQTLDQFLDTTDRSSNVVVGDFNETPWSFALKRLDRLIGAPRATHGLATWPTPNGVFQLPLPPFLAIDQAYVGERIGMCSLSRGPNIGSDHYPLLIKIDRRLQP